MQSAKRFQTVSNRYAQFRPQYPHDVVRFVAGCLASTPDAVAKPVLDIGSGTGIFTRQLAHALPPEVAIIGIEPSSGMREQALHEPSPPSISYRDGTAEHLPIGESQARGIVAATAAHWFDRAAFYNEAARVVAPGGPVVIVEYVRDEEGSPAAGAVVAFLQKYGEKRAYERPDYAAELGSLADFEKVVVLRQPEDLILTPEDFAGLALSSSHARKAIEDLGQIEAHRQLTDIGKLLAGDDGMVRFGYIFQAFAATRCAR